MQDGRWPFVGWRLRWFVELKQKNKKEGMLISRGEMPCPQGVDRGTAALLRLFRVIGQDRPESGVFTRPAMSPSQRWLASPGKGLLPGHPETVGGTPLVLGRSEVLPLAACGFLALVGLRAVLRVGLASGR
jgi:hypothetical protein